jgi:hypothetical protein
MLAAGLSLALCSFVVPMQAQSPAPKPAPKPAPARSGGTTTAAKPASGAAAAASKAAPGVPVKPADVPDLIGTWTIPLDTPTGPVIANVAFRVEAGKVVAGISSALLPEQKTSAITKNGNAIIVKASMNYEGALSSYSGPVTMILTLTPKGKDMAAWFDFNNSSYTIGGTAKKKA